MTRSPGGARDLLPEEEAIGDPDDEDDEIDDLLPADLWFRVRRRSRRGGAWSRQRQRVSVTGRAPARWR